MWISVISALQGWRHGSKILCYIKEFGASLEYMTLCLKKKIWKREMKYIKILLDKILGVFKHVKINFWLKN